MEILPWQPWQKVSVIQVALEQKPPQRNIVPDKATIGFWLKSISTLIMFFIIAVI